MLDQVAEDLSDEQLVAAIARRDQAAFEALYDRHCALVYSLCLRILQRHGDAQAVLSDVFWEVWNKAGWFDPKRAKARTYLVALARSRAIDALRARAVRKRKEDDAREERRGEWQARETASDPGDMASLDEERRMLVTALAELSPPQRQTLQLAYFEGLTHVEISEQLRMPLGSVKTSIRQGLMKLRHVLAARTSQ